MIDAKHMHVIVLHIARHSLYKMRAEPRYTKHTGNMKDSQHGMWTVDLMMRILGPPAFQQPMRPASIDYYRPVILMKLLYETGLGEISMRAGTHVTFGISVEGAPV